MNIDKETIRFEIDIFNQTEMEYTSLSCYLNRSPISQFRIDDTFSSVIKLKIIYKDFFYREIQHNWVFKLDITNKSLYRIIEDQIREEAKNNVYSAEDKELLKIFVKQEGHRTDDEIAEIFNEKEKVINQPEIIIPQIVEQEPIVRADIDIEAGLIDPKRKTTDFYYSKLNNRGVSITSHELFFYIIKNMYSSSAIDGTKGEISENNLYYDYIIPFSKVKNIYLSDFHFIDYYSVYSKKDVDEYEYILFCIYEKLKDSPYFVRYLAPIVVDKDSNMTVEEAVINYYDSISGRVSPRYQEKIDAFQKKYR